MNIKPFQIERYFAKYEFTAPYLLSCSDCEPFTLKELLEYSDDETIKLWENLWLGYTESQGHPKLRNEISTLYKNIEQDEIIELVPEEGIFISMNCILEKDDHVITTFPSYQSLYQIAESIGCNISQWTPQIKDGFNFEVSALKSLITDKTKLIIMNFPHNPTGATIDKQSLNEIIELARKKNIYIFSDEMYRLLEYNEAQRLEAVADLYENGVSLSGMSKAFSLPGLRTGWLSTKNKVLMKKFIEFKDYTTICNSAPSEILAIIALKAKNEIISRNLKIIKSNLVILESFFDKYNEFLTWKQPNAGPIAFPELKAEMNITDFAKKLVEEKGLMLLPSSVYGFSGNNFRLGFGRKNIEPMLNILGNFLEENF
ncbi:MAG: aminotransferase class I/II-fold pyridoxal phosphate-dependent enzyme [bacterium]